MHLHSRHRWGFTPQYIEQFRIVPSIFKMSAPKTQSEIHAWCAAHVVNGNMLTGFPSIVIVHVKRCYHACEIISARCVNCMD